MLLTRDPPVGDRLMLAPDVVLTRARAHEATGPARRLFALLTAARLDGPVLWLRPAWSPEKLMGDGTAGFIDPARLIFAEARAAPDLLWAAEEALRSGAAPLVIAELPAPPLLTPVRRLHLAAETGATRAAAPVMLLLTPDPGGAPGIETRWHLAPLPGWAESGTARWRLTRLRARAAPRQTWTMRVKTGHPRLELILT